MSKRNERQGPLESAISAVENTFPFPGYMKGAESAYKTVATTVQRYLEPGARVLDFGSGPCDKSAILQHLGYQCSALDDLGDLWHDREGVRDKIVAFASGMGVDFHWSTGGDLPYADGTFDMVMLHDVLEHLHDSPRLLLSRLIRLLRAEGYLFLTVPNAGNAAKRCRLMSGRTNLPAFAKFYWSPGPWRGHVREYVRQDLRQLCGYLGLRCAELRGCHNMLQVVPNWARAPYRAVTARFDGLRDSWLMVGVRPQDWTPLDSITIEEYQRRANLDRPYF